MWTRQLRAAFVVLLGLAALPAAAQPAAAGAMSITPAVGTTGFFVATSPSDEFEEAVLRLHRSSPDVRPGIEASLSAMSRRLRDGEAVALPGMEKASGAQKAAALDRLQAKIRDGALPAAPEPVTNYPKRGAPNSARTAWVISFAVAGAFCTVTCTTTDKVTLRITVNPGAVSSRFDYTALYSPNSGNFTDIHFEAYAICYGTTECASRLSPDIPPYSGSIYLTQKDLRNATLAHAFNFRGYFQPLRRYQEDYAKTSPASCRSDYTCRYP